mgnify:CR=1 FL=1
MLLFPKSLPEKYAKESLLQIKTKRKKTSKEKVSSKEVNLGNPNAKLKGSAT